MAAAAVADPLLAPELEAEAGAAGAEAEAAAAARDQAMAGVVGLIHSKVKLPWTCNRYPKHRPQVFERSTVPRTPEAVTSIPPSPKRVRRCLPFSSACAS